MSRRIHKFRVPPPNQGDHSYVEVPHGAELLTVDSTDIFINLWAVVETEQAVGDHTDLYTLVVMPTGNKDMPPGNLKYLNTCIMERAALVWHVFLDEIICPQEESLTDAKRDS